MFRVRSCGRKYPVRYDARAGVRLCLLDIASAKFQAGITSRHATHYSPYVLQVKNEALKNGVARNRYGVIQHLRLGLRAVDVNPPLLRFNQPAELRAVGGVLLHLGLQRSE